MTERRYRMVQIGMRNGKPLWRGTGFNQEPGGITWISYERERHEVFQWLWA